MFVVILTRGNITFLFIRSSNSDIETGIISISSSSPFKYSSIIYAKSSSISKVTNKLPNKSLNYLKPFFVSK